METMYEMIGEDEDLLSEVLYHLPEHISWFHRAGADLYPFVYDPTGDCLLDDSALAARGCDDREICSIRTMAVDDFHDPARLRTVLFRCLAVAKGEKPWTIKRKWLIRELKHMIEVCDEAMEAGTRVQIS